MGKIIENYSLQQQLGSGVYSRVYKAINLKTKQEVAIKMVKAQKFKQLPKLEEGTVNEINILSNLDYCPHIIKYFDMLKTVNNFYFVYEYCNGGTLENLLKKQGPLSQKVALNYFSQIVQAFKVLNKNNIMHRDLKPDNILIHEGILKLGDFGFCKPLQNEHETTKTMLGSPIYMAPQILKGQTYTIKADIWSLGVVLFRMLFGYCPFQSSNIAQLIMIIQKEQMRLPNNPQVSTKLADLLRKMLTKDPNHRVDWSEIFSYQIKNGQIVTIQNNDKKCSKPLTDSGLKNSVSTTFQSNVSTKIQSQQLYSMSSREFPKNRHQQNLQLSGSGHENPNQTNHKPDFLYNPRDKMRNTYSAKSPLRQNLKKDMMLKNHSKCIQLTYIISGLCKYQCNQSLVLAYMLMLNIQRELSSIMDSIRRDNQLRAIDQQFIYNFIQILENQIDQIKANLKIFEEQIRNVANIQVENVQFNKRKYLKKYISSLKLEQFNELVLASRILDLLEDSLVIRKQTYQKMSREQLIKKIKQKVQSMNDF